MQCCVVRKFSAGSGFFKILGPDPALDSARIRPNTVCVFRKKSQIFFKFSKFDFLVILVYVLFSKDPDRVYQRIK